MDAEFFRPLEETLDQGTILWPHTQDYSKAIFIGNLCYRMARPDIVVQAKSIEDVRATINFAREKSMRLTVKNGGHSYMGYCLNENGIVLDLCELTDCKIDLKGMTIKMQGGLLWKDVYAKFKDHPRNIVLGGQCPTVGVSGFTLGGGLSPFSRSYGLACDSVLEMTVVTWEGKVVKVSKDHEDAHHRDLFWALTGGGGGNFGVTVDMTCKLHKLRHEQGTVVCGRLEWDLETSQEEFDGAMHYFNTHRHPDELTIDALWGCEGGNFTAGMTVIYNGGLEEAMEVLAPFIKFNPSIQLTPGQWMNWENTLMQEGWGSESRVYHHHASFILAEGAITTEVTDKISKIVHEATELLGIRKKDDKKDEKNGHKKASKKPKANAPKANCHFLWDHIGGATTRVDPIDTAFYWRQGNYVATIKMQWVDPKLQDRVIEFIKDCKAKLLPHAIQKKAAYINYIDGTVKNWEEAYYGGNYPRLQKVKTHWDPNNFFWNQQSIRPHGDGNRPSAYKGIPAVQSHPATLDSVVVEEITELWQTHSSRVHPQQLEWVETEEEVYEIDARVRSGKMHLE